MNTFKAARTRSHPAARSFFRRGAMVMAAALTLAACGSGGGSGDEPATAVELFEGETITFIVPHAAGGGSDATVRMISPYLTKYLPGNPSIRIENITTASGMTAMNQFAESDPDGLTLVLTSQSVNTTFLFGDQDFVNWSFNDLEPIAGLPGGTVNFATAETGLTSAEDLMNGDYEKPLIYAGIQPTGGEIARLLAIDLLELDLKQVFGFENRAAALLGLQKGEAGITGDSTTSYLSAVQPMVDAGEMVPLYTLGDLDADGNLVRDPRFPELPHPGELAELAGTTDLTGPEWDAYRFLVNTTGTLQRVFATQAGAPQVAVDAYKQAVADMMEDPEFQEKLQLDVGYDFIVGDELDALIKNLVNPPSETVDWINDWLRSEYSEYVK